MWYYIIPILQIKKYTYVAESHVEFVKAVC